MKFARVLVLALAGAPLPGCEELVNPRHEALDSLTQHVILPLLEDLQGNAGALASTAHELCDAPGAERLEEARGAWDDVRGVWKRAEVLSFGPHTLSPFRIAPQIDFWPVRVADIDEVLQGDVALRGDDALREVGGSGRGFAATEYLLFTSDGDATAFVEGELAGRRCDYLIATSEDLHTKSGELHAAWRDDFAGQFVDQTGDHYMNMDEAFGDLVNSLAFTIEVVRDDKLGRPLGRETDGEPQPDLVESRFAKRSLEDALDVVRGIEDIFDGGYRDASGKGLAFVLRERHRSQDAVLAGHFDAAKDALHDIDVPLDEAVVGEPERVETAIAALRELLVFFQVDVAQALGVTATFGGADGD